VPLAASSHLIGTPSSIERVCQSLCLLGRPTIWPLPPCAAAGLKPNVIAQRLAFLAFEHSLDKDRETPYR
jgi:hypothetical protein